MLIENVDDFALWLINELRGLSDADPEPLSKYVIALLKKDKSESSLRKICVDQLNVFLNEKTEKFIDDVFDCLKHKRYLINNKKCPHDTDLLPKFTEKNLKLEKSQFKLSSSEEEIMPDFREFSPVNKIKNSDDEDKRNIDSRAYSKRTREHSGYRIHDESRKKKRYDDIDIKDKRYHTSRHKSHRSKKHGYDRMDYHHRGDEPKLIDYSNEKRIWDIKTSCPDFVEKGVCLRGEFCEFDHGKDIVRSDINCIYSGASMPPNTINSNWQGISLNQTWVDKFPISKQSQNIIPLKSVENNTYIATSVQDSNNNKNISDIYDPSHPEIDGACEINNKIKVVSDAAPVYVPSQVESIQKETWWKDVDETETNNYEGSKLTTVIGSSHGRQRFKRLVSPRRGSGRYNHKNPEKRYNRRQATARCLLLTHIPLDCNDELRLRQHFRAFGKVIGVQVGFQGDQHHALVEFATVEHAQAAFRSPLPILDNRFIRTSLFERIIDSNLTLCKDTSDDEGKRKRKVVAPCNGADNDLNCISLGDESINGQCGRQKSTNESDKRNVTLSEETKTVESKECKWPSASDLKLDRRPNESEIKPKIKQNDENKSKNTETNKDRDKKLQKLNEREDIKNSIVRFEESIQSYKRRLRTLLEEQKKPDCDQELNKRQLIDSYNYFKELKVLLETQKKKDSLYPDFTEEEKLQLKIKNAQNELVEMNNENETYRKQLKTITELKRELIKLQTISSKTTKKHAKLPSIIDTKLDNRPKTVYVTGISSTHTIDDMRNMFKNFQIEKIEPSDNDVPFFSIKFKTRKEADRVFKEMTKILKEKHISLSYDKPIPVCDPLDFQTRSVISETHRGTPSRRDECASSEDEDESKNN